MTDTTSLKALRDDLNTLFTLTRKFAQTQSDLNSDLLQMIKDLQVSADLMVQWQDGLEARIERLERLNKLEVIQ